ncbi:hypothetical protein MJG53_013794 [Ovis ammon polii x Ovis aries]|uniref:Uncharacterized protein n=1 Tax=Ovis ammon polii x Ovis aries TaxID=2918886 RepID=A0ACB9UJW9_9CETA|nr:hypothetical protein MJG53_013794 [Ovis ammon polii x Ovis aries]
MGNSSGTEAPNLPTTPGGLLPTSRCPRGSKGCSSYFSKGHVLKINFALSFRAPKIPECASDGSIQWLAPPKNTGGPGDSVTSARDDNAATEEALADDANASLQSQMQFHRRRFCQFPEKMGNKRNVNIAHCRLSIRSHTRNLHRSIHESQKQTDTTRMDGVHTLHKPPQRQHRHQSHSLHPTEFVEEPRFWVVSESRMGSRRLCIRVWLDSGTGNDSVYDDMGLAGSL